MKSFMQKVALILICLPSTMLITLLTASQVQICQEYAMIDETIVTMVLTIPNLFIILGLLVSPILLKKFHGKDLILAFMTVFVIVSVLPTWCENFYLLLVLRAISGISFGVILPIQSTYIAAYAEKERAQLLGLNIVASCIVGAVVVYISGIVAAINWRYVFYLYLLNALSIVVTALFLSRDPASDAQESVQIQVESSEQTVSIGQYGKPLFVYYFLMIGHGLFITVLASQMAPYLENLHLGGSTECGLIMSVNMMGALTGGVVFQYYIQYLKQHALPGLFVIGTIGMVLLSVAPMIPVVGVAAFILGMCASMMASILFYRLSCELPLQVYTTASAWLNIFVYALQFFAPILFAFCIGLVPMGSFRIVFAIYAVVQFVMIIMAYLLPKVLLERNE